MENNKVTILNKNILRLIHVTKLVEKLQNLLVEQHHKIYMIVLGM